MKQIKCCFALGALLLFNACKNNTERTPVPEITQNHNANVSRYYIDVHDLEPAHTNFEDVLAAHKSDLAIQEKYHVKFQRFWVDEKKGKVYCLSEANRAEDITATHQEAHGLLPSIIYNVSAGLEALAAGDKQYFMDLHYMGAGKISARDVEVAHEKDLYIQHKHAVNFINYWVDEKAGVIMCLSEAGDSNAVKRAHQEAHGLLPAYVLQVKEGQ